MGRQSVDVRTPVAVGDAQKIGKGLWRKQVLPIGTFRIGSRTLNVTRDYVRAVAAAFRDDAYDTVPTMLADKSNDHTMALLDEGGEVLALDDADDGLYATVQLSAPANERVERNRRLGVSVRIREQYDRADGKHYPAAMQHLLLTWDPRIPGMKPWEPIDLSTPDGDDGVVVLDLSAATYDDTPTTRGEQDMGLTDEELATVRAALPLLQRLQDEGAQPPAEQNTEQNAGVEEDDDAEFARIAAEIFGDLDAEDGDEDEGGDGDGRPDDTGDEDADGDGEDGARQGDGQPGNAPADRQPAEVAAANTGGDVVELANTGRDADRQRIIDLSNQLDASNYERERDTLVRDTGLPPSIIDLAQPLLQGSRHVVELSNGTNVDAGEVMRRVLAAIGQKIKLLDLSAAIGTDEPDDEAKAAAEQRTKIADQILSNIS